MNAYEQALLVKLANQVQELEQTQEIDAIIDNLSDEEVYALAAEAGLLENQDNTVSEDVANASEIYKAAQADLLAGLVDINVVDPVEGAAIVDIIDADPQLAGEIILEKVAESVSATPQTNVSALLNSLKQ